MKANYDMTKAKRGAVLSAAGKTRITIYLDDAILEAFRQRAEQEGKGYQTLINEALAASLAQNNAPVTVSTLRRILREELHAA
ncbi:MAG: BrnA antitoxin family protein [Burkholderiaceae bacterium]|nr:BrnA antitoxin family protein [Sulfuritalea sp.]MCF8173920.1 BrnA antitoxin family protein [Burkholderiaceae bacterium]MCF8185037.1 BrnA antitoxin family protein [Polynucleobacter sp.]